MSRTFGQFNGGLTSAAPAQPRCQESHYRLPIRSCILVAEVRTATRRMPTMELMKPDRTPKVTNEVSLETIHRDLFEPIDQNLQYLLKLQKRRRDAKSAYVETVVTYGAYEQPI